MLPRHVASPLFIALVLASCVRTSHVDVMPPRVTAPDRGTVAPKESPALSLLPWDVYEKVVEIQKANRERILRDPEIQGLCIAEIAGRPVFDVLRLPGSSGDGSPIDGIPVRDVEVDETIAMGALMGTSTNNDAGCFSGTLGMMADRSGTLGYVTNNHVAAAVTTLFCPNATTAAQFAPASGDQRPQCPPGAAIGSLENRIEIVMTDTATTNVVDAAFVKSTANAVEEKNACGICFPVGKRSPIAPAAALGVDVQRCARRSTIPVMGKVTGTNCSIKVKYKPCGGPRVRFVGQIRVDGADFSRPGDSGAMVYGKDGGVLGLLFAGNPNRDISWVNPIDEVTTRLGVTLRWPSCP